MRSEERSFVSVDVQNQSSKNMRMTRVSFLLSLGIVFFHGNNYQYYGTHGIHAWIEEPFWIIGQTIVPLFFIISGVNFYRNCNSLKNVISKINRRIKTLLVPYLFWQFLTWLFFAVLSNDTMRLSFSSFFDTVVCGNNTNLWYMTRLMVVVAVTPVLWIFMKHLFCSILLLAGEIIAWMVFFKGDTYSVAYALFFFSLGMCLRRFGFQVSSIPIYLKVIGLFIVCLIARAFSLLKYGEPVGAAAIPLFVVMSYLLYSCLYEIPLQKCSSFETQSFLIYVMHGPVIISIKKILLILLGTLPLAGLLNYLISVSATLFLIYFFYKVLLLYSPQLLSLLTGGRGTAK